MKKREPAAFLADMVQICEEIIDTMAGCDLDAFLADRMRQKAIVRDLEVLGEAARNLPEEMRAGAPGVPWAKIVAMRNRLIHAYSARTSPSFTRRRQPGCRSCFPSCGIC